MYIFIYIYHIYKYTYLISYSYRYIYIWGFPEMAAPLNCPFIVGFSLKSIYFGIPPFMDTHQFIAALRIFNGGLLTGISFDISSILKTGYYAESYPVTYLRMEDDGMVLR